MCSPLSLPDSDIEDWMKNLRLRQQRMNGDDSVPTDETGVQVLSAVEFHEKLCDDAAEVQKKIRNMAIDKLVKFAEIVSPKFINLRNHASELRRAVKAFHSAMEFQESAEGANSEAKPSAAAKEDVREEDESSARLPAGNPGIPPGPPPGLGSRRPPSDIPLGIPPDMPPALPPGMPPGLPPDTSAALPPGTPPGLPPDMPAAFVKLYQDLQAQLQASEAQLQASEAQLQASEAKLQASEAKLQASEAEKQAIKQATELVDDVVLKATGLSNLVRALNNTFNHMATLSQAQNQVQQEDTRMIRKQSQVKKKHEKAAQLQYGDNEGLKKNVKDPPLDCLSQLVSEKSMVPTDSIFHPQSLRARWESFDQETKKIFLKLAEAYVNFISKSHILDRPEITQSDASKKKDVSPGAKSSSGPLTRGRKRRRDGDEPEADTPIPDKTKENTKRIALPKYNELIALSTKELISQFDCILQGKEHVPTTSKTYFPGPRSQEVQGAQPFFFCLLSAIASLCEKEHVQQFNEKSKNAEPDARRSSQSGQASGTTRASSFEDSQRDATVAEPSPNETEGAESRQTRTPPKIRLGKESAVQDLYENFRYGDFSIGKDGRHIWIYRADTLPIMIEIITLFRGNQEWGKLEHSSIQQIVNHLSRYVRVGFDFAGAGAASHATGAIGSLAYVQVYRLELRHPGTANAELKIVTSDRFPLMSKGAFEKWSTANGRVGEEVRLKGLEELLFPKEAYSEGQVTPEGHAAPAEGYSAAEGATASEVDSKETSTPRKDDIPEQLFALLALYELVQASRSHTFGQTQTLNAIDMPFPFPPGAQNAQLLASGSFGNVYWCSELGVFKVSRHGRDSYLKSELYGYKAIGQAIEDLNQVEKKEDLCRNLAVSELQIKISDVRVGSAVAKIPSLRIAPRGRPLLHFGDVSTNHLFLCKMVFDVALALKHMHSRSVAHNDVSLSNVVVVRGEDESERAVLVDLSIACPFSFEIPSFRGHPVYAHRDIHKDKPWSPRPFHDMAALGFLAAVLASGSVVPWRTFSTVMRSDDAYEQRLKAALDALKGLRQSSDNERAEQDYIQIKEWVEFDVNKTILRCYCTCGGGAMTSCNQCRCRKNELRCCPTNCKCAAKGCENGTDTLPLFAAPSIEHINYDRHDSAMAESEH